MLKTEHFFIIGGGSLQKDLVLKASEKFFVHVFDYDDNCVCKKYADLFHLISIDDKETILSLARDYDIVGIATCATELGNITACYVGEKLGLGTNSYQTSLNTTNKVLMKKVFSQFDIPSAQLLENINENSFPLVVKPSDRSAGRGVVLVESMEDFDVYFENAKKISNNGLVIVEKVLNGKQFSVECISSNGMHQIVTITEEYIRENNGDFLETQQLIPARLSLDDTETIKHVIFKILEAFNVKYGASHIEIKLDNKQVYVIEIATRMGGWRNVMIKNAYGIDYNQLLIDSSLKNDIEVVNKEPLRYCLVKFIFTKDDFLFYKYLKQNKQEMIIEEYISDIDDDFDFGYSSNLLDSKGYYYLNIPLDDNPDKYIKNIMEI